MRTEAKMFPSVAVVWMYLFGAFLWQYLQSAVESGLGFLFL